MSRKYKFYNTGGLYFVSFATVYWIDVFTRQMYLNILAESIAYCRAKKGMELFAYCFMPNHVHFVFRSKNNDPCSLLRDYKRYTSRKVIEAIEDNPQESRKEWLLWMFKKAGKENIVTSKHQFWQHHNKPIELWSNHVIEQKINYIHNNPIVSGFVNKPEDWKYSSANNYAGNHSVLEIDI